MSTHTINPFTMPINLGPVCHLALNSCITTIRKSPGRRATIPKVVTTFIVTAMVISSTIFIMINPEVSAVTAGNPNGIDTSAHHSNMPTSSSSPTLTVSQDEDFTTQAALSLIRASQTNNFVSSKSYYDISFRTATAGTIKSIVMDFPADTSIGSALVVEATGIGPGTLAASAGEVLTYTVTNAVNVPALTNIRIQISNINNPPTPSGSFTVSITTRNAANGVIDGPTPTSAYNMVQVGNTQIAPGAVTTTKIATGAVTSGDIANGAITSTKPAESFMKRVTVFDSAAGHAVGWDPNSADTAFAITEPSVVSSSYISVTVQESAGKYCSASPGTGGGLFVIQCDFSAPSEGAGLDYVVINLPANVVQ
jgi:hypothetical protein